MARLIFTGSKFGGRIYEFALSKTTVGRGDHNTLTIHDPSVSQTHCEILVYGPEVIVRDLGSSNGTFVNGLRLCNQQCQLKPGQTVRFGLVEARLELDQPSFSDTATAETAVFSYIRHRKDDQNAGARAAVASMKLEPPDKLLRNSLRHRACSQLIELLPRRGGGWCANPERNLPDPTLMTPPPAYAKEIARRHQDRPPA